MVWQMRGAAFLAALILPTAAGAQAPSVGARDEGPADRAEAEEPPSDLEADVSGAPLQLGAAPRAEPRAATRAERFETEDGWGIVESELRVAPAPAEQPEAVLSGDLPERPAPEWPGENLLRDWDFAEPYSFVSVAPQAGVASRTFVGDVAGATNFVSRLEAELYLLRMGANLVESVGGERTTEPNLDLDLRIPIAFGEAHRFALVPGVTIPIGDESEWTSETTNARVQALYGFGAAGVGLQLRAGITEGPRQAGLLGAGERLDATAALWGGLVAWRVVPALQLRAEASGELATDEGEADRISLLPGVAFFPLGDPRVELGLAAVIEDVSDGLDFDDPRYGGVLDLGVWFD